METNNSTSSFTSNSSNIEAHVIRLMPSTDLYAELLNYITVNNIEAAFIMTCVGSLQRINLRKANAEEYIIKDDKYEIVSLVGCLSAERSHLHISLSDTQGSCIGGHLMREGNIVYTTAEIVLGVLPRLKFKSEFCHKSGWEELKAYKKE